MAAGSTGARTASAASMHLLSDRQQIGGRTSELYMGVQIGGFEAVVGRDLGIDAGLGRERKNGDRGTHLPGIQFVR